MTIDVTARLLMLKLKSENKKVKSIFSVFNF